MRHAVQVELLKELLGQLDRGVNADAGGLSKNFDKQALATDPSMLQGRAAAFGNVVESEDYATAETTQKATESGLLEYVIFGRNEPPLHHYHNTFREALGMEPLPLLQKV